jgi:leucyl-tRNA synthetase
MSKSLGNVVNPDEIIRQYGADALKLYEMFLGLLDMIKPWSTKGIEGVSRFLRKILNEYIDKSGNIRIFQKTYRPSAKKLSMKQLEKLEMRVRNLSLIRRFLR